MSMDAQYLKAVAKVVQHPSRETHPEAYLNLVLRKCAMWRSQLIANTVLRREGAVVLNGRFAGMVYGYEHTEGALLPRLLGS